MLARQKALVVAKRRRQALAQERAYGSQGRQVEGAANRQRSITAYRNYQAAHELTIGRGAAHNATAGRDKRRGRGKPIPRTYGHMSRTRPQRGSSYS